MMRNSSWLRIGFAFLLLQVLLLIVLVPVPPLVDYPNHLARMALIGGAIDTAPLNRFYLEDWHQIATNLPLDVAAKLLLPALPLFVAGKLMVALAAFLPLAGLYALNRREMGNAGPWPLFFLLLWAPLTFLFGFLNFQIGLGVALIGAAAERRDDGWRPILRRLAFATGAFACHPFGLLLYCALLAAIGFGGEPIFGSWAWKPRLLGALKTSWICFAVLAVYYAVEGTTPGVQGDAAMGWFPIHARAAALITPVQTYYKLVDRVVVIGVIAYAALCLWRGTVRVHLGLMFAAGSFVLMTMLVPDEIGTGSCLTYRFPLLMAVALFAGTKLEAGRGRWTVAAIAFAVAVVSLHTAAIGEVWFRSVPLTAAIERVSATLPPGTTVFAMRDNPRPRRHETTMPADYRIPFDRHLAALAVPIGKAFYPGLFAMPGLQPLRVKTSFARLNDGYGGDLLPVGALHDPQERRRASRFDYMLLLCPDRCSGVESVDLRPVRDEEWARLYRIAAHPLRP